GLELQVSLAAGALVVAKLMARRCTTPVSHAAGAACQRSRSSVRQFTISWIGGTAGSLARTAARNRLPSTAAAYAFAVGVTSGVVSTKADASKSSRGVPSAMSPPVPANDLIVIHLRWDRYATSRPPSIHWGEVPPS